MTIIDVLAENAIVVAIWIILGSLVGLFIFQTIKKDRKAHYLTFGLVIAWLGVSAWTIRLFLPDGSWLRGNIPIIANGLLYPIAYYGIYVHYELIYRYRPRLERLGVMSGILASAIVTSLIILLLDEFNPLIGLLNDLSHDVIRLGAFSFAAFVTARTWHLTREREPLFELSGILLIIMGTIPAMLGNYTDFNDFLGLSVYEWGDLLTVLGLFLIVSIFIYNADYLYRMPVPLYHFLVFNASGIAILSMPIKNRKFEIDPVTAQLISGPLTAIISLFEEVFRQHPEIEYIKARRQTFLFESARGLTATIIGEQPTYFVKQSLSAFLKAIPTDLIPRLNRPYVKSDDELTMTTLLEAFHRAFPYVDVQQQ